MRVNYTAKWAASFDTALVGFQSGVPKPLPQRSWRINDCLHVNEMNRTNAPTAQEPLIDKASAVISRNIRSTSRQHSKTVLRRRASTIGLHQRFFMLLQTIMCLESGNGFGAPPPRLRMTFRTCIKEITLGTSMPSVLTSMVKRISSSKIKNSISDFLTFFCFTLCTASVFVILRFYCNVYA